MYEKKEVGRFTGLKLDDSASGQPLKSPKFIPVPCLSAALTLELAQVQVLT